MLLEVSQQLAACAVWQASWVACEKAYLNGIFSNPQCEDLQLDPEALHIHLRSGDIWVSHPHSGYGQPPLAYYTHVLQHQDWTSVLLITEQSEDKALLHPFATILPVMFNQVSLSPPKTKHEDLRTFMCAHNLVTAKSSLGPTLLWYNENLLKAFVEAQAQSAECKIVDERLESKTSCDQPEHCIFQIAAVRQETQFFVMPRNPVPFSAYGGQGWWRNDFGRHLSC